MSSGSNFTDFGELVLVIGDFHIPYKKAAVPAVFRELLSTDKIKTILCTGNVGCDEIIEDMLQISPNLYVVKGEMDANVKSRELPESIVLNIGQFRVGLINGYQILPTGSHDSISAMQRKLGADILIHGSTSKNEIFQTCGKFFINPGSITGAGNYSLGTDGACTPSFMLMAVQGPSAVVYVYELVDGKANVSLSEFSKSI